MGKLLVFMSMLLLLSCAGDGGSKDIIVTLIDKQGTTLWGGKVFITYNTKKPDPKRISGEARIVFGSATFKGMKKGNYSVTFSDDTEEWCARYIEKCGTNFRLTSESDSYVTLEEGKYLK